MIAINSVTEDDFYAMPLPFAVFSWAKLGVKSVVFRPAGKCLKIDLAEKYCFGQASFKEFYASKERIPTYSQVSRLFGGAIEDIEDKEVLITTDSDMCVFGDFFTSLDYSVINIIGVDLTPEDQFPMCYAMMPKKEWKDVFKISNNYQYHLEEIINPIQSTNLRGTSWCLDQFLLKKHLLESGKPINFIPRSNGQNQFAQQRADRDGWHFDPYNIIDAHLPRPLTDNENFEKVFQLFKIRYPNDDLTWMREYQQQYKSLL